MKSRINKLKYRFEKDTDKDIWYYKNGGFHRDNDLPAVLWENGIRIWFKNGKEHRDNGKPSTICSDGKMEWKENGEFIKDNYSEIKNK